VILITYISIVIGELVPKTIALSNPESIVVVVAPAIQYFSMLFYPFVKLLSFSTNLINRILGIKKRTEYMTEAELRQMIKIASYEGVIQKEQNLIHEKVFYFSDKKAKHIMTPRRDVDWLDIEKSEEQIRNTILKSKHSHLVVGRQSLDNFIGILSVREYFTQASMDAAPEISKLVAEPLIVPENMDAQKVLNLFRLQKKHIALVVNEYGSFEGIVTLHDMMENIVGSIPEEGEQVEPDLFVREDMSVLVNGDASIETLTEVMENFTIDFEEIDYSTVAGFVFHHLNKIPQTGDTFEYKNYLIEIVDMDGNRIDKVLIRKVS
jgi:putative hemolysin